VRAIALALPVRAAEPRNSLTTAKEGRRPTLTVGDEPELWWIF